MEEFQIIQPSLALSPYVKHYWFLKAGVKIDTPQRVISDGYISLVFHRGSQMNLASDHTLQERAFLSGQNIKYSDFIRTGNTDMISITFRPHGARMFFFKRIFKIEIVNEMVLNRLFIEINNQIHITFVIESAGKNRAK